MKTQITIDERFCGPPDSGNGGYTCGLLGGYLNGAAEVKLFLPPPMNRALDVEKIGNKVILSNGGVAIAEAVLTTIDMDIPRPPSFLEAQNSAMSEDKLQDHFFPTCFVCGPKRKEADGLRIFPGPVDGRGYIAAPWIPSSSLTDETGKVRKEIIWAALDCPGGWAILTEGIRIVVLGKLAVEIIEIMNPGDRCVIIGWKISEEGRKITVGSALFSDTGNLYAKAKATWIELKARE
jgi:hypothetical protein